MNAPLYAAAILRLAASIPHDRRLAAPHATVEKRSSVCGSRVVVDVIVDDDGRIVELGQEVRACALGQASAALMGAHVIGRTAAELATARNELADYLVDRRDDPGGWPGLDTLAAARAHHSRHASILLAFDAAQDAAERASAASPIDQLDRISV